MIVTDDLAFNLFRSYLSEIGLKTYMSELRQDGRHLFLITRDAEDNLQSWYVVFKHSRFQKFSQKFQDFISKYPGMAGEGDSINLECLMFAKNKKCRLVFIYDDGSFYKIMAEDLYNFVHDNSLLREQDVEYSKKVKYGNGLMMKFRETTASFPIKLLERMET